MSRNALYNSIVVLLVAGILAKAIGAIYRIPLTWVLGTEGLGIYQLVFPLFSLLLVISSTGAPTAISTMVADCLAKGKVLNAKRIFKVSLLSFVVLSVALGVVLCLLAIPISNLQGNPQAYVCYWAISLALPFVAVLSSYRGYFQGYLNMLPTAFSQLMEQMAKLVFGLLFAQMLVKNGAVFGALGAIIGVVLSEICAVLFVVGYGLVHKKHQIKAHNYAQNEILEPKCVVFKQFVKTALPIVLCSLILPLLLVVDSLAVVPFLNVSGVSPVDATKVWGVYSGVVNSLINLPVALTLSIAVAVAPSIRSELCNKDQVYSKISDAFFYALFISLPCAVGLLALSGDIIPFLYGDWGMGASDVQLAIKLLFFNAPFVVIIAFVQVQNAILQGLNKLNAPLFNMIYAGIAKIALLCLCVVPSINILGVLISNVVFYVLMFVLNWRYLRAKVGYVAPIKNFFPCLISSAVMSVFVFMGTFAFQNQPLFLKLVLIFLVGASVYFFTWLAFWGKFNFKSFVKSQKKV